MLIRTHLAVTICAILLFISNVNHKFSFVLVALLATFIPDIDSRFSTIGKKKSFRILQFFIKHRGLFHSFSFLLALSLFFALFFPIIALPFFLGYGLHLFIDSFTVKGIKPFYPYQKICSWKIKTQKRSETVFFVFFLLIDLVLLFTHFLKVFYLYSTVKQYL